MSALKEEAIRLEEKLKELSSLKEELIFLRQISKDLRLIGIMLITNRND